MRIAQKEYIGALCSERAAKRNLAWRSLFRDHVDYIFRLACCLGVGESEAEDVIQQVLMVAHRRVSEMVEITNLRAWLRGITVRVIADRRKWNRVRAIKDRLLRATEQARSVSPVTPERSAEAMEAGETITRVLSRMSPKLREVLVLTDLEECAPSEVAALLRIPVNTVRSRRRLAREEFSRIYKQRINAGGRTGP